MMHSPTSDIFEEEDAYLVLENEKLHRKVRELEKVVSRQQNEMILLQTSTADILRRLAHLETRNATSSPEVPEIHRRSPVGLPNGRLSSRVSQSSYSLASSPAKTNGNLSKSYHSHVDDTEKSPKPRPTRAPSQGFVNISMGRSARGSPLRKWLSDANVVADGPSTSARCPPMRSNINSLSRCSSRRNSMQSSQTLYSSRRSLCNYRQNPREATVDEASKSIHLHINGRNISVPIPSKFENLDPFQEQKEPDGTVKLDWVYGYRGRDVRHNLHSLPTGDIVYFCGTIVVLYNLQEKTQRSFTQHTSDVRCLTVHPNRHLLASGQSSRHSGDSSAVFDHKIVVSSPKQLEKQLQKESSEAHVLIWDSINLSVLKMIEGFEKAVVSLAFSQVDGGVYLGCIDDSHQHTLSIWDWNNSNKVTDYKCANEQIFGCLWHPTIKGLLVVYGKGHFNFWLMDPKTKLLSKCAPVFEGRDRPKIILAVCFTENGTIVTGDSNGTISLWDPATFKTVKQAHNVHNGGVYCLSLNKKGHLLSGGKDRMICEWEAEDLIRRKRPKELPDDVALPRCIVNTEGAQLIIGTSCNAVFKGDFDSGFDSLIQGSPEDVLCLRSSPDGSHTLSASLDGCVRYWNNKKHVVDWAKKYGEPIECIALASNSLLMAIGFSSGNWITVDMMKVDTVSDVKETTQPITALEFSPASSAIFVATKDLSAFIYRIDSNHKVHRLTRLASLSSWIISVDWDEDGQYIRANSSVGHLHYWNTSGEVMDSDAMRDVAWKTTNCAVSFEAGLATHSNPGTSCVTSSADLAILGRDNGLVKIYSNPVQSVEAGCHVLHGHRNRVTSIAIQENYIISAGAGDSSLIQWSYAK